MTDCTYDQYVPGKGQAKSNAYDSSSRDNKISHSRSTGNYTTLNSYLTLLITLPKNFVRLTNSLNRILLDWLIITQIVKTLSTFMEPKGALSCPQQPITIPGHESHISEPPTSSHPISGSSNLILYNHLCWSTYSDK